MKVFSNLHKKHYIVLVIWVIINLLQAFFTDLHSDESYYWVYSENLAWGFFDHPPMVALFIKLGYLLFQNELGVRLMMIVFSTLSIAIIFNELNEKKDLYFLTLFVLSFPLVHTQIGGFLATPDIPLVFFTLLFFLLYRKFLAKPGFSLSILLAVVIAAMVYSKYHSILIIGLTVLSNFKLLKNKYFWLIVFVSALLLLPHIWWQIDNELPSFKYHLSGRARPFRLKYVTGNIMNQLIVAGPLTGVIIFWKALKLKIKTTYERAMATVIIGFYVVLFIFSFWNRIEAHWIAAVIPLLMFITYPKIANDPVSKKWFKRLALSIIILFFLFRFYIAANFIPNVGKTKITFYKRGDVAKEIQQLANGKKVGFFDNYAFISNYIFYTGEDAVLLSHPNYRFCQYDLLNDEAYADGGPLFLVYPHRVSPVELTRVCNGEDKGFLTIDEFQSLKGLSIFIEKATEVGNKVELHTTLTNNSGKTIQLTSPSEPALGWRQGAQSGELGALFSLVGKESIKVNESISITMQIPVAELQKGNPVIIFTHTSENNRGEMSSFSF